VYAARSPGKDRTAWRKGCLWCRVKTLNRIVHEHEQADCQDRKQGHGPKVFASFFEPFAFVVDLDDSVDFVHFFTPCESF
jgi:hypothetical protein